MVTTWLCLISSWFVSHVFEDHVDNNEDHVDNNAEHVDNNVENVDDHVVVRNVGGVVLCSRCLNNVDDRADDRNNGEERVNNVDDPVDVGDNWDPDVEDNGEEENQWMPPVGWADTDSESEEEYLSESADDGYDSDSWQPRRLPTEEILEEDEFHRRYTTLFEQREHLAENEALSHRNSGLLRSYVQFGVRDPRNPNSYRNTHPMSDRQWDVLKRMDLGEHLSDLDLTNLPLSFYISPDWVNPPARPTINWAHYTKRHRHNSDDGVSIASDSE